MSKVKHSDTYEIDFSDLEELVQKRWFDEQEMDRLLAWEILRRIAFGRAEEMMQPSEFCDRIHVNPRFTNRIVERVRRRYKGTSIYEV